jgi:hypothetical protein
LIEERREELVGIAIDESDMEAGVFHEGAGAREPAESGADDNDSSFCGISSGHVPQTPLAFP